jgi:hypothetical protein
MNPRLALAAAFAAAASALAAPAIAAADPIAPGPVSSEPAYSGAPHTPRPVAPTRPPQNPNMATDPNSNLHNDSWMTDAYPRSGPLGESPVAFSRSFSPAICGSITFDSRGRLVAVCPSILAAPQARIIDPETLEPIATFDLPTAPDPAGQNIFQNFTGGGYFFLDGKDRLWVPTKDRRIFLLRMSSDGKQLVKQDEWDLRGVLKDDERVTSALPDWKGRIWFVSKKSGKVGTLDPKTDNISVLRVGEEIQNSFAIDRDATYIVSDKRMYRFSAGKNGKPKVDWKVKYDNSGIHKPSQVNAGSGTTPTLTNGGYVAITDNADPMQVVVYRTATKLKKGEKRTVCEVPVFGKGGSATENSLIAAGRSFVVENNYGYMDPFGPNAGAETTTGFARVDVNAKGTGCKVAWSTETERAPSVVPKLSTKTGLIYTYTQDRDAAGVQRWSWTALDFRTGKTAWKQLAGTGPSFNNNYAGIAIGPNGSMYLGVLGGVVGMRDGS